MASYICPGYAQIFIARDDGANNTPGTWYRLPHTITWEIASSIEDPTEIRTSDTGGSKVAVGAGATTWTLNATSALCEDDWLYAYILAPVTTNAPTNPNLGDELFFCLTWEEDAPGGATAPSATIGWDGTAYTFTNATENSVYLKGTVNPAGFGFDNDSTDPAIAEWSANVTWGPWYPAVTAAPSIGAHV